MIRGLFETHIPVSDFKRSRQFYEELLGLDVGWLDEERQRVLYWVGAAGKAMLGVRGVAPEDVSWQHLSFEVSLEDMTGAVSFLKGKGIECHNLIDKGSYPQVFGWMPAVSLFFNDPDGHSLEFIAMLPDKPRPDIGSVTWDEWKRLNEHLWTP